MVLVVKDQDGGQRVVVLDQSSDRRGDQAALPNGSGAERDRVTFRIDPVEHKGRRRRPVERRETGQWPGRDRGKPSAI